MVSKRNVTIETLVLKNHAKNEALKLVPYLLLFLEDFIWVKVGLSPSKKNCVICFIESPFEMMKNAFYFTLKALFVLKIIKFFSWLFGQVGKTAWLERWGCLQNSWRHNLVNKKLQYTYWPKSYEVKAARQWNLVN